MRLSFDLYFYSFDHSLTMFVTMWLAVDVGRHITTSSGGGGSNCNDCCCCYSRAGGTAAAVRARSGFAYDLRRLAPARVLGGDGGGDGRARCSRSSLRRLCARAPRGDRENNGRPDRERGGEHEHDAHGERARGAPRPAGSEGVDAENMAPRDVHRKSLASNAGGLRLLASAEYNLLLSALLSRERVGLSAAQYVEMAGIGVAQALLEVYPVATHPRVLVAIGPGSNGCIGLAAARHLAQWDAQVTAVVVRAVGDENEAMGEAAQPAARFARRLHPSALSAARACGVRVLDFLPRTIEFYFDVVLDALFGVGIELAAGPPAASPDARAPLPAFMALTEPFDDVIGTLAGVNLPLASVDVPSGWHPDDGPRLFDLRTNRALKPELLVSVGAPKQCARYFGGNYHYLAGNFVPHALAADLALHLPSFPSARQCVLLSSNPFSPAVAQRRRRRQQRPGSARDGRVSEAEEDERHAGDDDSGDEEAEEADDMAWSEDELSWGRRPGEVYGRPGQYMATLFDEGARRTWVDVENDPELWDELD